MPYINDSRFLTLPQQVKKNKDDIQTHNEEAEVVYADLEAKDAEQDVRIENHDSDIEQLQDAVASGGVIVTRKIGLSADLAVPTLETKIDWDLETEASNEPTAVNKDVNNDHTLITDGKYKVEVPVSITNGPGSIRNVTINIYVQDTVTFQETLIKTQDVAVGSSETVNTSVQVDYTKANNTKAVLVKVLGDSLTVLKNSENHVTSYFTVAGAGTVTQTKNIAPTDVSAEGVNGDEANVSEILTNLKSDLITKDSNDTVLKRLGVIHYTIDSNGNLNAAGGGRLLRNIANPTLAQDAVTKAFMEKVIVGDGATATTIKGGGSTISLSTSFMNMLVKRITNVVDPSDPQDAATKNYVDTNSIDETTTALTWSGSAFSTAQSGSVVKLGTKVVSLSIQALHPGTWAPSDLVVTLPTGYRPTSTIEVSASKSGSNSAVTCQINTSGQVTLAGFSGTLGGQIDINTTFNIV